VKGLLLRSGECVLLGLAIGQGSRAASHSRKTEYLEIEYELADSYDEKVAIKREWEQHERSSETAHAACAVFSGLAAACWAVNVLDAVFFGPDEQSARRRVRHRLVARPRGAGLCCTVELSSAGRHERTPRAPTTVHRRDSDKGDTP
jgi:hypothetical protein